MKPPRDRKQKTIHLRTLCKHARLSYSAGIAIVERHRIPHSQAGAEYEIPVPNVKDALSALKKAAIAKSRARRPALKIDQDLGLTQNIYVIECEGFVKIGLGFMPEGRLQQLQVGCPFKLHLVGTFAGTADDEKALHSRFARLRHRGEWFRREGEIEAWLNARLKRQPPTEIPTGDDADRSAAHP